ncbi:MAG: TOBE domain-containing protein [Oxalobacteraceae bacterium]|jgi:molybdate transport system regulatory protein|nr:TOBE domain-containing protein [Oxalobacteraceae bacterium]
MTINRPHSLPFSVDAELSLRIGETPLANKKRIELLRQIGLTENLTKAAKIAGYSYKGAWDTIEQMTQLTGDRLLERHAGGKGGGRTCLTERGKQLLKNFDLISAEHARFVQRLNRLANGLEADYALLTDIAMKTSARNQLGAIIVSMLQGPVNDEIGLMVNDKLKLIASITHESCRELKLEIGAKVFALIKASAIEITLTEPSTAQRINHFEGVIDGLIRGEQSTELKIVIDEGGRLIVTANNTVLDDMQLRQSMRVHCRVDPSNVILAVAA